MGLPRSFRRLQAAFRARSAARDENGATAIEFAIVGAPFLGLMLLVMQVGHFHFALQSLDFAVRQGGRAIMTGQVSPNSASASNFKTTYICPKLFWNMECSKLIVNAYILGKSSDSTKSSGIYAYINSASKSLKDPATAAGQQKFCLGGPGDYVYIDLAYPYPNFVMKLLRSTADSTWQMRSSTVIFNEPTAKSMGSSC